MTTTENPVRVEALLAEAVEALTLHRTEATTRRYRRVLAHLSLFLDRVDVRGPLGLEAAARLEVARDLGREGSFLRCFGLLELISVLPLYLDDSWLAVRRGERVAQLRVVSVLARRGRRFGVAPAVVQRVEERISLLRAPGPPG